VALEALFQLKPEGWAVVLGGMGSLTLVVGSALLKRYAELKDEEGHLRQVRQIATAPLETDNTMLEPQVFDAALAKMPKGSSVRRATEAVLAVRAQNAPDLEAIMGMVSSGETSKLGWVRAAPNLYMLLGLFGTVLGLASSIGSLGPQVASAATAVNPGQLSQALGVTLTQMQDAFGCSLWGIILALISAFVLTSFGGTRSRFLSEVERYALVELVPATLPRSSEEMFERQQKLIKGTANTFREFDKTMNETIAKFDGLIGATGATVEKTLDRLGGVAAQMDSSLSRITDGVEALGSQLSSSATALARAQEEGASRLAAAQVTAAQAFESAEGKLGAQLSGQVQMMEKVQGSLAAHADTILGNMTSVSNRLDNTVAAFRDSSDVARVETQNLKSHLDDSFRRLAEVLGEQVQENQRAVQLALEIQKGQGRLPAAPEPQPQPSPPVAVPTLSAEVTGD
jgi:biopolymer transport protein ExbB/TolQ